MKNTPLAKVGKKRAAAIADGSFVPKPRTPIRRGKAEGPLNSPKADPLGKARRKRVKAVSDRRAAERGAYEAWRQIAILRADGVCEWCEGPLPEKHPVHHLFEVGAYPHLRLHPANGMAVCSDECHRQAHLDLAYARAWWAVLNPEFAALAAITPDVAAIMHPRNAVPPSLDVEAG